jgi:chromosome segregation ATPase
MPVTFTKLADKKQVKAEAVETVTKAETALVSLADPLHEMLMEAKQLRSKLTAIEKKMKPMKAEFLTAYNEVYPDIDESRTIEGEAHSVKVAATAKKRQVSDIDTTFDLLESVQEDLFKQLCKVNLTDLDKYLTPEQLDQVIEVVRDPMSRTISPVVE